MGKDKDKKKKKDKSDLLELDESMFNFNNDDDDDDDGHRKKNDRFKKNDRYDNNRNNNNRYDNNGRNNNNRRGDYKDNSKYMLKTIETITEEFVNKKKNTLDTLEEFSAKLLNPNMLNATLEPIMKLDDDEITVGMAPFGVFLFEFGNKNENRLQKDIIEKIYDAATKLIKPRVKELGRRYEKKKHRPNENILIEAAVIVSSDDIVNPKHNIFTLVQQLNSKLYGLSESEDLNMSSKDLRRLYEAVLDAENLPNIAVGCLLERVAITERFTTEHQANFWDVVNNFSLDTLNALPKDDLSRFLKLYTRMRYLDSIKKTDGARRLDLIKTTLAFKNNDKFKETYSNLIKVVKDLCDEDRYRRYLGQ